VRIAIPHTAHFGTLFVWLALLAVANRLGLAQTTNFRYIYDDKNQLIKVIDSTGVMIQYVYDPVGNMLKIIRSTVTPGALTIFNITPMSAAAGGTITIQGQGFSTTPSANTVTLNGFALTVLTATSTNLVVQVPPNATAGPIFVTVGGVTVTSSSSETILPLPNVLSLSPKATLAGTAFTLTVAGTNLTGSTFAFSPMLPITSQTVNSGGTSATLLVSPPASALGYYTLVAANGIGQSSAVPVFGFLESATVFNTISIPGSNPNADPDQDGLTNAQELTGGTDPLNPDTDGDHYPDGIEVLFGSDPLNPLSIPTIPTSAGYYTAPPFSLENTISPAVFSPQTYLAGGLRLSLLNTISPASFSPQTYKVSGLNFSMLNSISPASFSTQTYQASGLSFSMLNSISPASFSTRTYQASGRAFSMLNAISPAAFSTQKYESIGLPFSILNGTPPPLSASRPGLFRSGVDAPSLRWLLPVDAAFIAAALARGAQRIDGKPVCQDTDGDGLCDDDELVIGTNPYIADTDGDGFPDGLEVTLGSDPLNPKSIPDTISPGYLITRPVSLLNRMPIATLTPRQQGALNANNR